MISVDPGLKTGLALVASGDVPRLLAADEVDVLDVERSLLDMLAMVPEGASLLSVVEKFTINARTVANSQAPWSLEVIGIARNVFWRECRLEPIMQQPVEAKDLMTNPRLRAVDCWYKGGAGHANDAIRHALFALHRRGWRDRRLLIS